MGRAVDEGSANKKDNDGHGDSREQWSCLLYAGRRAHPPPCLISCSSSQPPRGMPTVFIPVLQVRNQAQTGKAKDTVSIRVLDSRALA